MWSLAEVHLKEQLSESESTIFKADIQSQNSESIDGAATIVNGVSGQEKEDWPFEEEGAVHVSLVIISSGYNCRKLRRD